MDHIAILAKKRKLLNKILSGEKTIESRWTKTKKTPYNTIKKGDRVYFKDAGEPVTAQATVEKVLEFNNVPLPKIKSILRTYGKRICIPLSSAETLIGKKYCTLIFLRDVKKIKPFTIDKRGYGLMAAWMTMKNVNQVKKSS